MVKHLDIKYILFLLIFYQFNYLIIISFILNIHIIKIKLALSFNIYDILLYLIKISI